VFQKVNREKGYTIAVFDKIIIAKIILASHKIKYWKQENKWNVF
jgi:hypothetical protein